MPLPSAATLLERVATAAALPDGACAVASPLDAVALLVHVLATWRGWTSPPSAPRGWAPSAALHTLRFVCDKHSVEIVLVPLAQHTVVLGTSTEARSGVEHGVQRVSATHCEFATARYTAATALPPNTHDCLVHAYVSEERVFELASMLDSQVLAPLLAPASAVHGAAAPAAGAAPAADTVHNAAAPAAAAAPTSSLRIGDADRDPLAASPDLFRPGASFAPPPLFGGAGGAARDGMLLGPQHPLWDAPRPPPGAPAPPPGALSPGTAALPSGARFDPVHPFGLPRGPRSGDPDWDELAPPGMYM